MPRKHNTDSQTVINIKAKRAAVSAKRLRERRGEGEDVSDCRALVRVGVGTTRVLTGEDDLSEWDDDELIRGQRKDKNGRFQGRRPLVVPMIIHQELVKRRLSQAAVIMRDNLVDVTQTVVDIALGADSEDKDRLKAAEIIMNRMMGKAPERVEFKLAESKMEAAFKAMLVPDEDDDIVDAEVIEDDEDDEPV